MKKADRQKVFDKYGGKCAYCGCDLEKGWHVDHVEPCRRITRLESVEQPEGVYPRYKWVERFVGYANPDANHIDNYMPSCPSCNINKHGDTIEGFRESIAGYLRSLNLRMVQYKMAKKYGLVEETGIEVRFYFEKFNSEQDDKTERRKSVQSRHRKLSSSKNNIKIERYEHLPKNSKEKAFQFGCKNNNEDFKS